MHIRQAFAGILLCATCLCQAAEVVGMATVVDGDTTVIRQTTRWILKPGGRLYASDLIETSPSATLTRIEMSQGLVADLGPATRIIVMPKLARQRQAELYAVGGWVKLSTPQAKEVSTVLLRTESLEVTNTKGSAVLQINEKNIEVFAESGAATVAERRQRQTIATASLKAGSFLMHTGKEKGLVLPRPPAAFIQKVPRSFLDPAPLLTPVFSTRPEPALKSMGDLTYAQAMPWLGAETAVVFFLVSQWKTNLNKELRAGLTVNIKRHPEWRQVLFPEPIRPVPAASSSKVW